MITPPAVECPHCDFPLTVIDEFCPRCETTFGPRELWDHYETGAIRAGNHEEVQAHRVR